MKIDLAGVNKLKFPLTLNGMRYAKTRSISGQYTISFTTPRAITIDMTVEEEETIDKSNYFTIWLKVDGIRVTHGTGISAFQVKTDLIPDAKLKAIVEAAIRDLAAEERRLDPTGRHAEAKRNEAAAAAYRAKLADDDVKLKKTLKRL